MNFILVEIVVFSLEFVCDLNKNSTKFNALR